ncbi:MAG: Gfo/Idh/MocA family oxidoreductase [Bacteroidota bacterium]|nr:Gfo/Idh/MocA family oxidoreductase [Bacteroidota bacterium]MDE2957657.1 Gfo/Idh/MocA family oxidoreductase [Bacteroidota bacterium]
MSKPLFDRSSSRRDFLRKSSMGAAAVIAGISSASAQPKPVRAPVIAPVLGANDTVICGFIGVGGQGFNSHLLNVTNRNREGQPRHSVPLNAIGASACDLFSKRRDQAHAALESARQAAGREAKVSVYEDYRPILDNPDIDAVFIGTVDHWHKQIAIDAMDAGKHVYCEKPMTRYLMEGFEIHDKVLETGMKFQIGSQFCTEGKWHVAADLIRNNRIGPLVSCQDSYCRNTPIGEWNYYELEPELEPGKTIDWQKWLGPVADREFSAQHYHRWRKYYPYCAGILGDLLAHRIHPLLIATGAPEFPKRVCSVGNKKIGDSVFGPEDRDVTDNCQLLAEFPSGLCMTITGSSVNEQGLSQVIRGNEGTLYFSGSNLELRPERPFADLVDGESQENITPTASIPEHIADFFGAIRDDRQTNGNIDVAIKAQTIISMAEMSERLGEMLYFNAEDRTLHNGGGTVIEPISYGTLDKS